MNNTNSLSFSFPCSCVGMHIVSTFYCGMDSHAGAWEPERVATLINSAFLTKTLPSHRHHLQQQVLIDVEHAEQQQRGVFVAENHPQAQQDDGYSQRA